MEKDDYHVIAYRILAYLYHCLKSGTDVDAKMLLPNSRMLQANERYWLYIIYNLSAEGYIDGVDFVELSYQRKVCASNVADCMITLKGIEYLFGNSAIEKARRYLEEAKENVPFDIL